MDSERGKQLLASERERIEREIAAARPRRPRGGRRPQRTRRLQDSEGLYQDEFDAGRADDLKDRLAAVERAEERLAAGTYGLSVRSGEPIPDDRLEANPTAELTVAEQDPGARCWLASDGQGARPRSRSRADGFIGGPRSRADGGPARRGRRGRCHELGRSSWPACRSQHWPWAARRRGVSDDGPARRPSGEHRRGGDGPQHVRPGHAGAWGDEDAWTGVVGRRPAVPADAGATVLTQCTKREPSRSIGRRQPAS